MLVNSVVLYAFVVWLSVECLAKPYSQETSGSEGNDFNFLSKRNVRVHRKHKKRHHHGVDRSLSKGVQNDAAALPASKDLAGATVADNATLQAYLKSNCSTCIMREEAKHARIAQIKAELLQKLGFTTKPTANASRDVPSFDRGSPFFGLLESYGYQSDSAGGVFSLDLKQQNVVAKTERIYSFATDAREKVNLPGEFPVSLFEFSDQTRSNLVTEAKLNVYIKRPEAEINAVSSELTVEICEVNKTGQVNVVVRKKMKQTLNHGSWSEFNVKRLVQKWFTKPSRNFGIHVRCRFRGENLAVHPSGGDAQHKMYLNILTEEGEKSKRQRRNAMRIDCKEESNETRCCRYPLVIDFEKFGWDFVIAPKKYLAYYCSGSCPFKYLQRYVHTHLVQQTLPDGSGGPCCYPTEMAPIMMVYLNDNREVLVSQVPGMVATRCGCA